MKTLRELYASNDFQTLSFENQQAVKNEWLMRTVQSRPDLQRLAQDDPNTFTAFTNSIMQIAPAMTGYNPLEITDEERAAVDNGTLVGEKAGWIKGVRLYEKLVQNPDDPALQLEASTFITGNSAANESLLYKIVDGGIGYIEELFGKQKGTFGRGALISPAFAVTEAVISKNEIFRKSSGQLVPNTPLRDKDDLNRLASAMGNIRSKTNPGETPVGYLPGLGQATALGTGFVETIALTFATMGTGAVVSEGAQGAQVVGKAGLFTRGLFGETGAFTKLAASARTAAGTNFWRYVAPAGTEAIGSGLIDSFRAIPDLLQKGQIQGDKAFWTGFAGTFGQGAAYDLAFNALGGVMQTAAKPFVRVFRKINPASKAPLEEIARAGEDFDFINKNLHPIAQSILGNEKLPPGAENLSKEVYDEIVKRQAQSVVWSQIKDFSFTDPKSLGPLARAVADMDVEQVGEDLFRLTRGEFSKEVRGTERALYEIFAQGTSRGSFEDELFTEIVGAGKASALGGNPEARFRTFAKLPKTALKSAKAETLVAQIPLTEAGSDMFTLQAKGVAQQLFKNAGLTKTEQLVELMPQNLLKPAAFQTAADELKYFDDMDSWFRRVAGTKADSIPSLRQAFLNRPERNLSINGLNAAAGRVLPNGRVDALGQNQFRISFTDPTGKAITEDITGLREANNWFGKRAVEAGLVSQDELADQFFKQTGMKIEWQETVENSLGKTITKDLTNEWGQPVFRVRRPNGDIQESTASSMVEVLNSQPGFTYRLPDSLAPDILFDNSGVAWKSQTILAAPMNKARQILDGYIPSKGSEVKIEFEGIVKGVEAKINTLGHIGKYEVEIPSLGFRHGFDTKASAMRFLNEQADSHDLLQTLAHERGFKLEYSPSGSAYARDVASSKIFPMQTKTDIENFLKAAPDPSTFSKNIFDLEDQIDPDGAWTAKIQQALGETPVVRQDLPEIQLENMGASAKALADKETVKQIFSPARDIKHVVMRAAAPRHETLRTMAQDFGIPEINKHVTNVQTASSIMAKYSNVAQQWIKKIAFPGGKKASRLESKAAWVLVQNSPQNWDSVLDTLSKTMVKWTPDEISRIKTLANSTNQFFTSWGRNFGIDGYDLLQNYIPKLRNIRSVASEYGFDDGAKKAVLDKLMGGASEGHRPLQFFAKNGRLNDLVQLGEVEDVISLMSTYAEMGLREKYLGPAIESLQKFMDNSAMPDIARDTLEGFKNLARGGITSGSERSMQTLSLSISTAISDGLRKLTPLIGDARAAVNWDLWAKDLITSDLPGKAGGLISYATLGFRPWRGLSNMMQFHLNVMPIYGSTAYTAQGLVDPAYIQKCFDLGLITDKVLAQNEIARATTSKILNAGLSPQQNSEYLVRAWTAKTVELQFRDGLNKLANKVIDEDEFLKYTKAYLMSGNDQQSLMDLLRAGKVDGAEQMLQRQIIDLTMFNYEKSNKPQMMTGVVGKMFGKFGVYPIGQINLYRKVLTSDKWSQRLVTFARFAAISSIVYNAFRAAGVDYSGFRMQDPFSFSGGPLFSSGMDLLKAKTAIANPDDPDAKAAWGRVLKNWSFINAKGQFNVPRLAVPGYLQAQGMTEGARMFYEGEYYSGVLRGVLGAPIDNDTLENGFKWK